jgi:hypothetical protein
VFTLAATTTGSDAGIRSPFGQRPSYLSLMLFDGFDRGSEDAWLVGMSYRLDDFALPSWSFVINHAESQSARDPRTGADLNDLHETDFTVDYRPESRQARRLVAAHSLRLRRRWRSGPATVAGDPQLRDPVRALNGAGGKAPMPMKRMGLAGGWDPKIIVGAPLLNGAWALGVALLMRLPNPRQSSMNK